MGLVHRKVGHKLKGRWKQIVITAVCYTPISYTNNLSCNCWEEEMYFQYQAGCLGYLAELLGCGKTVLPFGTTERDIWIV